MKKKYLLLLLCVPLLVTGCGKVPELQNGQQVIVEVNGKQFTAEEFFDELKENYGTSALINLVSNYYLYGINTINVIYDPNTIYELRYLITDGKIDIDNIIGDNGGEILRDEDNNIIAKKYELNDFNVLVCENDKNILANKSFELNKDLCY